MAYLWASSSCRSASAFRSPIPSPTLSNTDNSVRSFGFGMFLLTLLTNFFGIKTEQMGNDLFFVAIEAHAICRLNGRVQIRMSLN